MRNTRPLDKTPHVEAANQHAVRVASA